MGDHIIHSVADDCWIYCCADGLHSIDQKRGQPADEHVSKQNGLKLCEFNLAEIWIRCKYWKAQQREDVNIKIKCD